MSRPSFDKILYEMRTGYETKRCGIWETVKRWVSLYEIKEATSPGGYLPDDFMLSCLEIWQLGLLRTGTFSSWEAFMSLSYQFC